MTVRKTFTVAVREFISTVMTKAFLLVFLMPIIVGGIAALAIPLLMNAASPKVSGHVAIIDQSGSVGNRLEKAFTPEAMEARRGKIKKDAAAEIEKRAPGMGVGSQIEKAPLPKAPELTLQLLGADASVDAAKAEILKAVGKEKDAGGTNPRLALAVIPASAVKGEEGKPNSFKDYELFVAPKLDPEVQSDIRGQVSQAIVDARIEASGLDVERVRALTRQNRVEATAITKEGEKKSNPALQFLLPGSFLFLMWISVFTAGQYLLSSTIEEKSNRVMEVLLSAVSPMELMVGKIIGQMAVASLVLAVYAGAGLVTLVALSLKHLIDPMQIVYLCVYFVIGFALVACMMAAVGSAVSDVREAQSLLTPVMLVLMVPMMLWMPILRNPNSLFAQIVSFVPPISPFVMVLRLSGSEKVPTWQIPATIVVGLIGVVVFAWAAAKIFRIGVLMYGKPPNFTTLIKWIRMA
ncbi:MAG: ABC transporter permease [Planctomycetes bacterium]|nr:ABC transporter permease [Planctomycetota bacterium]